MKVCRHHQALIKTCRYCQAMPEPAPAPAPATCEIHGTPLTTFCAHCRGSAGGKKSGALPDIRERMSRNSRQRKPKPTEGDQS